MPTFIKHAKCKNSPKKIDETAIKMDICGKMAIKRSNEGVFRPTRARHAIQKINFAWPNLHVTYIYSPFLPSPINSQLTA